MAHLHTFRWIFTAADQEYYIYGCAQEHNQHNFGHGKDLPADPYYRINLLDPECKFEDHGNDGPKFAADQARYQQLANAAYESGKRVFVINCVAGKMRTGAMAAVLYQRIVGGTAGAVMEVLEGAFASSHVMSDGQMGESEAQPKTGKRKGEAREAQQKKVKLDFSSKNRSKVLSKGQISCVRAVLDGPVQMNAPRASRSSAAKK